MNFSNVQKMQNSLDDLENDAQMLQHQHIQSPCISITGFRYLDLFQTAKKCNNSYNTDSMIITLFHLLKLPTDWILSTGHPPQKYVSNLTNQKLYLPFEAYIYLSCNSIKLHVYRKLVNYVKKSNQKNVHIRLTRN